MLRSKLPEGIGGPPRFVSLRHKIYTTCGKQRVDSMKDSKLTNQSGLTLLEVMIAMVIMSISLLLLLNMAMVALDGNDWSNKTTIATQLMQEKLEQLRNSPTPGSGGDTALGVVRNWTVTNAGSHLRQVGIDVTWEDIRGNMVTDSLSTFIKTDSV